MIIFYLNNDLYTNFHLLITSVSLVISPINNNNNELGSYLTGLIKEDSTIIVPKTNKTPKGPNNYGYMTFVST